MRRTPFKSLFPLFSLSFHPLCIVRDGRPLSRMHLSLQPTTNLKKVCSLIFDLWPFLILDLFQPQDLPPASTWINHKAVLIYGDIILYTRNYVSEGGGLNKGGHGYCNDTVGSAKGIVSRYVNIS